VIVNRARADAKAGGKRDRQLNATLSSVLRKLRWGGKGRGKRGGLRIIYYRAKEEDTFYMLFAYSKSEQEDLTPAQMRVLSRLVREEFK
jgi:mRNA-degrading endonuclease RelE of RelBE toxin-antitoxin system